MNVSLDCIDHNTLSIIYGNNVTICSCHQGYYGNICQYVVPWYRSALIVLFSIVSIVYIIELFMIFSRYRYYKNKSKIFSNIILILTSIGILSRLFYIWFPSKAVYDIDQNTTITVTRMIINYLSITLMMISSCLLVGFWYEIIRAKFKLKISKVTKIISIVASILMVSGLIPGLYYLANDSIIVGVSLIIIPIFVNSIFLFIITIILKRSKNKNFLSTNNINKKKWVVKFMLGLSSSWILYMVSIFMTVLFGSLHENYRIIPQIVLQLSNILIPFSIICSFDYNFLSIKNFSNSSVDISTTSTSKNNDDI